MLWQLWRDSIAKSASVVSIMAAVHMVLMFADGCAAEIALQLVLIDLLQKFSPELIDRLFGIPL